MKLTQLEQELQRARQQVYSSPFYFQNMLISEYLIFVYLLPRALSFQHRETNNVQRVKMVMSYPVK